MVINLIAMHVLLELTSTIGYWQLMTIAALLCFAPPAWSRWVLQKTLGPNRSMRVGDAVQPSDR